MDIHLIKMKLRLFILVSAMCMLQSRANVKQSEVTRNVISGCPLFGCSPGGSFSFDLRFPPNPVTVKWQSEVFTGKSPQQALGCVGNSETIVCPISTNTIDGYAGFNVADGRRTWNDTHLHRPPLPLMDVYGDIIGCDGFTLLQYLKDGTLLNPVIKLFPPTKQIFSLDLANNGIFVMTSAFGVVTTYFSNGVPGGTTTLNYLVKNESGVFYPVSSPVIQGHRTYFLTKFLAENSSSEVNGLRRLFAIDMNDQFLRKIDVIWFLDLGVDRRFNGKQHKKISTDSENTESDINNSAKIEGAVLVHNSILFVTVGNSSPNSSAGKTDFWVFEDEGNLAFTLYTNTLAIDDLCLYDQTATNKLKFKNYQNSKKIMNLKTWTSQANIFKFKKPFKKIKSQSKNVRDDGLTFWGSNKRESIISGFGLVSAGIVLKTQIHLINIVKASVQITSKLMVARNETEFSEILVFGINILNKTTDFIKLLNTFQISNRVNTNYVVAVKPDSSHGILQWIIPVPGDWEVRGQIIGIPSNSDKTKDFLVAYTFKGNSTKLFAIN